MPSPTFLFLGKPAGAGGQREALSFGPTANGGFSTAAWVDVDPAAGKGPLACAVVAGRARFAGVPGTLLLQPTAGGLDELGAVLGRDGGLLFVWRNLVPASVLARLGAGAADVQGGASLGTAGPGGDGGWLRAGFEVVLTPRGLDLADDLSFARLVELSAEASLTRRLDPATFYAALRDPAPLAGAHQGHPLLGALRRRSLVELRDEWDEPFAGAALVAEGGAPPVSVTPPAGARGVLVLAGNGAQVEIAVPGCVLTVLPSDETSQAVFRGALPAPSHLAVQAMFMAADPAPDDEPRQWFAPNTPPRARFSAGNRVTAIRDGVDVFRHYVDAIRTANAVGHRISLAGWFLDDSFPLVPGDATTTFHALATRAAEQGAEVRALLWEAMFLQNAAEVKRINELPGERGGAILDDDTLDVGSHHQKFLVVNGTQGRFAFAGGVDISPDRLDTPGHGAPGPFHDVQLKVEGPAVEDIRRTFADRWNHAQHPGRPPLPVEEEPPPPAGGAFVQIACTFPPRKRYPFAPEGALDPLAAFERAVRKAKRFIYLEDQYLTPYSGMGTYEAKHDLGLVGALREALGRIDYLVMVVPNHTDQPEGRRMRAQFLRALTDVAKEKVLTFFLERDPPCVPVAGEVAVCKRGPRSGMTGNPQEIYCHSKTWIVDDIVARVGSANCCRRSHTHDSELDVVVVDGAVDNGARAFARGLRMDLWQELLRLPDPSILEDHRRALAFFRDPPAGSLLRRYDDSAELVPNEIDRSATLLDDLVRHLGVKPERLSAKLHEQANLLAEAEGAASAAVRAVEGAAAKVLTDVADHLEYDPVVAWNVVDPDGR
jgi:phosphatidylserine/phosphatidylglycerophosphate/cardiolipin synthase-like enzyme